MRLPELLPAATNESVEAGALLGAAMLLEVAPALTSQACDALRVAGIAAAQALGGALAGRPAIPDDARLHYSGVAHGWPGVLYAMLCWCRVTGETPPAFVGERVKEFTALAEPSAHGVRWPSAIGSGRTARNGTRRSRATASRS